jgi:hypothetical protein
MTTPWFEPNHFGAWYGGLVGGVGGGLGGTIGALSGILVRPNVGRTFILTAMYLMFAAGVAQLAFGIYAICAGQPWGIWYGPILGGTIFTIVVGPLIPMIHILYRQAEQRRLEAEGLRKG